MIKIVQMERKHVDQVYEVEIDSFSIPWTRESLEKEVTGNHLAIYIVALDEENVVGYAGMWHVVTEGHITNIAVKTEYRSQGIGDMLLRHLIRIADEKEMMGLTLEVRVGNRNAMHLYAKHGFKVEGIRKNYYADTGEDAVIMWKYLQEIV